MGKRSYRCWFCKQEAGLLLKCNYCGKYFCSDHSLPEMHNCPHKPRPAFYIRIPKQSIKIPVYERRPRGQEWRGAHKYQPKMYEGRKRKSGAIVRKIALSSFSMISCFFILFILVNYLPFLLPAPFQRFFSFIDITPPKIELISPTEGTYESSDSEPIIIPILYITNEPITQAYYTLNEKEATEISGNTTLILPPGNYNLLISAYDVAGNEGTAKVSFAILDTTPPKIKIISPKWETYESSDGEPLLIPLIYTVNEPTAQVYYTLNGSEEIQLSKNVTLMLPLGSYELIIFACDRAGNIGFMRVLFAIADTTPPKIGIVSPEEKIYFDNMIPLIFTVNEAISQMFYALNGGEEVPLPGNTTLNLPYGRHNLTICAYDRAGNRGFNVISFTVSRKFSSLNDLINYLRNDDLNRWVWRPDYTCHHFALEFIKRAENRGYYVFGYYALYGEELSAYEDAITSIKVVKYYSWGRETRWYEMPIRGLGHAVVKTSLDDMTIIIDPQTDVILKMEKKDGKTTFMVLYEGEITED